MGVFNDDDSSISTFCPLAHSPKIYRNHTHTTDYTFQKLGPEMAELIDLKFPLVKAKFCQKDVKFSYLTYKSYIFSCK